MKTTRNAGLQFAALRAGLLMALLFSFAQVLSRADNKKNDVEDVGNRKVAHKSIISQEKEIAYGKQIATEIDHSAKIITDPVINEYVNRVAQNVARNSDLTIPLTVKIIDDGAARGQESAP